jgi:hypothetical protein
MERSCRSAVDLEEAWAPRAGFAPPHSFGNGALASARVVPRVAGTAECRLAPRSNCAFEILGRFLRVADEPPMERGQALRWVACVGILSASRRGLSASIRAQLSRVRSHTIPSFRYSSGDARGGPGAASPPQCLAPRATTTKPARSLRRLPSVGPTRDDDPGVLPIVTSTGRDELAMMSGPIGLAGWVLLNTA